MVWSLRSLWSPILVWGRGCFGHGLSCSRRLTGHSPRFFAFSPSSCPFSGRLLACMGCTHETHCLAGTLVIALLTGHLSVLALSCTADAISPVMTGVFVNPFRAFIGSSIIVQVLVGNPDLARQMRRCTCCHRCHLEDPAAKTTLNLA